MGCAAAPNGGADTNLGVFLSPVIGTVRGQMKSLLALTVVGALGALTLGACGPGGRNTGDDTMVDAPGPVVDSPPAVDTSRVYAHSGSTLYRLDNLTLSTTQIGTMSAIAPQSLTDLAIDKDAHMVGVTLDKLYSIDSATGAATLIKALDVTAQNFTSLSFVPDPANNTADILIAASDQGEVFKIDQATGAATKIGAYGMTTDGKKIVSSGDIIGVRGFGIYATVDVGTETNDYLAKIDPLNNWKATVMPMSTGHNRIFGLGFWGGKIYGFVAGTAANTGAMIQIDPVTGASTDLSSGNVQWFGAAVGTDAPILQ